MTPTPAPPGHLRAERRRVRRLEIQAAACRLVVDRGFDGFTMDDLAHEVGVSRRTLFNHIPDKLSAVVGEDPGEFAPGPLALFCDGGPTGDLLTDAVHLLRQAFEQAEVDIPDVGDRLLLVERAVATDPKVADAMRVKCEAGTNEFVAAVCRREGWADGDLRARVLAARVLSAVVLVLDEVVRRGGSGSFVDVFDEVLAADAELSQTPRRT